MICRARPPLPESRANQGSRYVFHIHHRPTASRAGLQPRAAHARRRLGAAVHTRRRTLVAGFSQVAIMALESTKLSEPPALRIVAIAGRFATLPDRRSDATIHFLRCWNTSSRDFHPPEAVNGHASAFRAFGWAASTADVHAESRISTRRLLLRPRQRDHLALCQRISGCLTDAFCVGLAASYRMRRISVVAGTLFCTRCPDRMTSSDSASGRCALR